jgi:hypothetical protein
MTLVAAGLIYTNIGSVGGKPTEVEVRNLVAWIEGRGKPNLSSIEKAIFRMVSTRIHYHHGLWGMSRTRSAAWETFPQSIVPH